FTTNGQINPVITMQPNQYQVVSMVNNSASAFYMTGFQDIDPATGQPVDAATTTAAGSDGVPAKSATAINVASTAAFASTGLINVTTPDLLPTAYHYSGITPTSFTGLVVQGISNGNLTTGGAVVQLTRHIWPVAGDGNPFTFVNNPSAPTGPDLIAFPPA